MNNFTIEDVCVGAIMCSKDINATVIKDMGREAMVEWPDGARSTYFKRTILEYLTNSGLALPEVKVPSLLEIIEEK